MSRRSYDRSRRQSSREYSYSDSTSHRRSRRDIERAKARKKKLIARRATIVGIIALILILVITLIILGVKALFSLGSEKENEATEPTVVETQEDQTLTFNAPDIPDDKKSKGYYSSSNSAVYIYNNAAYELFAGSDDSAIDYADCISEFKSMVGDEVTVYNMIVPNHIEFGVPKRVIEEEKVYTNSQTDNIRTIYENYSEDVVSINCYNELSEHCKEYIYFNTDHHWTGLGAYYAYKAFCEQTDQRVLDLSVCTEHTIEGFEGSLLYCDNGLYENLDTVHYWTFPYSTYGMRTESNDHEPYQTSIIYESATSGPYAYGAFIWGDSPLFVEHNEDLQNGKKLAIVKESYGNAIAPFFTANYEEVHVIDFRYFEDNLQQYCTENGITEVLFVNNIVAANAPIQVDRIRQLYD